MVPDWAENDVIVSGSKMHYYQSGSGKTPLVLAHGFTDNGLCWLPVARDVGPEYQVTMPDARGHGLSERVSPGENGDRAADLAAVITALGIQKPIIGGHSMGAATAATLGARFPHIPGALVLEDPPWFLQRPQQGGPRGASPEDNPFYAWVVKAKSLSLEEAMELTRADHPTWPEPFIRYWTLGKQQMDLGSFAFHDSSWGAWEGVAKAIACPTLLITADPEKGGLVTPELARMVCEMNPLIQVAHVPGTGHHVRFENYPAYIEAFTAFLAQIA